MSDLLRRLFPSPPTRPLIEPGVYHRMNPAPATGIPYRLHLRVEADGAGVLIVNASTVLHLNETATAYAWHVVQDTPDEQAAAWVASRFRLGRRRARRDGQRVRAQIEALAEGDDHDPVAVMGLERRDPYRRRPAAPYRLDLALTFRVDADGTLDPHARRRVDRELSTGEWTAILDSAWSDGVPHVVFTGGEPTLRDDLANLIAHAEGLGQVTGLVVHGERLTDAARLEALGQAGLDHLLVVVDSKKAASLEGMRRAAASDIFSAAHLTLSDSVDEATLDFLVEVGIDHVSITSPTGAAGQAVLEQAREALAERRITPVWDLPVPYSAHNPIRLEVDSGPEQRAWLYVEPDGDVVASVSAAQVLGNAVHQPIRELWRLDQVSQAASAA